VGTRANSSRTGSRRRHLASALYHAAVALGRTRDASEVVRIAITETQRASHLKAVALYVLDAARQTLVLRESAWTSVALRKRASVLPIHEEGPAARAIRGREVITIPVAEHPVAEVRAAFAEHGFHSVSVAPVPGQHRMLGALYLVSQDLEPLSPNESALVQAIGTLVGVALENATLSERLLAQQERLQAFARAMLLAREAETRRIAHELHEEAGQVLAAVHMKLDGLVQEIPGHSAIFGQLHDELNRVEAQLRRLSHELRPTMLDDLGLVPTLRWLAQGVTERTGVTVTIDATERRAAPDVEAALYRIVQEGITNAVRHAGPRRIGVEIHEEGADIRAVVRNDGLGFDVGAAWVRRGDRGLGLIGMRERAEALGGSLEIRSTPDQQGTELSVVIPREPGW
jgi:signal transduction histidine kinase